MAVLEIGRKDTSYTLQKLSGPPGNATIFQVTGNRAHIVWNLGTDLMYVDLRGSGDSLTGDRLGAARLARPVTVASERASHDHSTDGHASAARPSVVTSEGDHGVVA